MKNKEIEKRILELREEVLKHDKLYDNGTPIITDTAYDKLYGELLNMEKMHPEFYDINSPTQRVVSQVVDGLSKFTHTIPMLSQDKVHNEADLRKFCSKADVSKGILVQYKLDGLTIVLTYEDGVLKHAVTRGNGYVGEIVTHTVINALGIPLCIPFAGKLVVRAEAIINFKNFERINANGEYKSPRNLVSGTVRTLEAYKAIERCLQLISFDLVFVEGLNFSLDTEMLEFLKNQGFDIVPCETFYNIEDLIEFCVTFNEKVRPNLPYMIDGLVLKFNDLAIREELGYTSKFPRWGCAFKFESQDATTKLLDVEWQVGKTGVLTPVAILDPVEIDGVTIGRASLANIDDIKARDIKIGDTVMVIRANDVIPKVISVVKEFRTGNEVEIVAPNNCPVCNHSIDTIINADSGKTTFYCLNDTCHAQLEGKLQHYVSRNCLNIDGLGDSTISLFISEGLIDSLTDIYTLKDKSSIIQSLEGMGKKKVDKMIAGIEKSKEAPLSKILYGLSISNIGESGAKDLAKEFVTMDNILSLSRVELCHRVSRIKDFGDVCSKSFADYFSNEENREVISKLMSFGVKMEEEIQETVNSEAITGKTFVITGTLSIGRNEMKAKVESFGGKVSGSVSKKTNYLLMGAGEEGSSKHKKALELGVAIISEEDFNSMI